MTIAPVGTARGISSLAVFSLLLISATVATAQQSTRLDVFGGVSYMRFDSPSIGYANYSNLIGWNASGTVNLKFNLSATVDLSGEYGSHLDVYNWMFGPQYTWRKETHRYFVHGLFGKDQTRANITQPTRPYFESVGKSYGGGGGVDWDLSPRITVRLQADYLRSDTFGPTLSNIRGSAGLVFHFGRIGHRPKL
jgi:hypothetical protein